MVKNAIENNAFSDQTGDSDWNFALFLNILCNKVMVMNNSIYPIYYISKVWKSILAMHVVTIV